MNTVYKSDIFQTEEHIEKPLYRVDVFNGGVKVVVLENRRERC